MINKEGAGIVHKILAPIYKRTYYLGYYPSSEGILIPFSPREISHPKHIITDLTLSEQRGQVFLRDVFTKEYKTLSLTYRLPRDLKEGDHFYYNDKIYKVEKTAFDENGLNICYLDYRIIEEDLASKEEAELNKEIRDAFIDEQIKKSVEENLKDIAYKDKNSTEDASDEVKKKEGFLSKLFK